MNKLPNGWQIKTLSEVCNIYTGNSINKQKKEKNFIGLKEGLNYIGTKDISFDNIIDYDNGVKIPFKDLKDFKVAKSNSTLLCIEGGSAGRKIGFTNQDICFGNKLCCFETIDNEPKFIFYYLQSDYFLEKFYSNIQGLIGGITKEKIRQIKIPLPPIEIQKQIAERLDFLFDKIDKALQLLNENKEYIKKYRLSILKDAFEGKLTRPSKNWEIKTLGEVCEITMGQSPNGKSIIKINKNTNPKAIEFHQGKIYFSDKYILQSDVVTTNIKKMAKKNSVLLCVRAPVGIINITQREIAIGRGLCALNSKFSNNDFLYFYLLTQKNYFNEKSAGSTFSAITLDTIKNTKIPIPPLEVQKEIVSILDEKFKAMEEIERLNNENIENLLLLKKSLLKDAFGGRL